MMILRNLEEVREEVEKLRDKRGEPVEEKIKPLVIGLRRCGIETRQSCEGHLSPHRRFSCPWVLVPTRQARRIARVVGWQNRPKVSGNKNFWVLRPDSRAGQLLRLIPEDKNRDLEEMQKDAVEFGLSLQNFPSEFRVDEVDKMREVRN